MLSTVGSPTNQNYTVLIILDQQKEPRAIEIGPEKEGREGGERERDVWPYSYLSEREKRTITVTGTYAIVFL